MHGNPSSGEHAETIETVRSIPRAMRNMGWTTSAELMERWLRSSAWVLPPEMKMHQPQHRYTPENTDESSVSMRWAAENPRVRAAMDRLRPKMANEAARGLLRRNLGSPYWGTTQKIPFGSRKLTASQLDTACHSNSEPFGGDFMDAMDDLSGALGAATLKVALIGEAARDARTGKITLRVTDAGFYIRDTYDFNGNQYLGAWTKDRVLNQAQTALNFPRRDMASKGPSVSAKHVSNTTFGRYRRATGYGGDFVIYSDVLWEKKNLVIELPA